MLSQASRRTQRRHLRLALLTYLTIVLMNTIIREQRGEQRAAWAGMDADSVVI